MTDVLEPIDEIVEMLPQQVEALECPDAWLALRGGVGSSKTFALCYDAWRGLEEYPEAAHFVVGADYEQLRRGWFVSMQAIFERHGLEPGKDFIYRDSPSPMITMLSDGHRTRARFRSLSAKLAERIRSLEVQRLYLEEPQTWINGEDIYRTLIGRHRHSPRTERVYPDMQIRGRMSFNPPAKSSWLFDLIEYKWPKEGYKCLRFSVRDNYLMRGQDLYIRNLEATYPESHWASEIDGHWKDIGGSVYSSFMRSIHTQGTPDLPPIAWDIKPNRPIFLTCDFNVEWMSWLLGQVHVQPMVTKGVKTPTMYSTVLERIVGPQVDGWNRRIHYVLDELFENPGTTEKCIAIVIDLYKALCGQPGAPGTRYGQVPIWIYGDASGGARQQGTGISNWQIVGRELRRANIPFVWRVPLANPHVTDRVNSVNLQLRTASVTGTLNGVMIDAQRCPNFVKDLEAVEWSKMVENTIDKSDKSDEGRKRTHLTDAYGYFAFVDRVEANGGTMEYPDWMNR